MPAQSPASTTEDFLSALTAVLRRDNNGGNLLGDTETGIDASGAKGAVAYARQKKAFETAPSDAWTDFRSRARQQLARADGQPTRFQDLGSLLPWGSFNTARRAFFAFASIAEAIDTGDLALVQGRTAQAMRWLALSIETSQDPTVSWKLTFLPCPMSSTCPNRNPMSVLDLNSTILCPSQLTSVIGVTRDMELLQLRINKSAGGTGAPGKEGHAPRLNNSQPEDPRPRGEPKGKGKGKKGDKQKKWQQQEQPPGEGLPP